MNWAAILWLVLLVVFILVEASTVTVVSIWFAAGAVMALIVAMLGGPAWLQILAFFVVSIVLLLSLRPVVRKYFTPRLTKTNVDSVIGTVGIVTAEINNIEASGTVKLGAMEWTARSTSGERICVGSRVRADRVEGVKVYVTPVEETVKTV